MRESLGQERSKQQGRGLWKDWKRGIEKFAGEESGRREAGGAYQGGHRGCARKVLAQNRSDDSGLEETRGDAIVAIELHIVEGGGDSVPSGRGGGFAALHMSPGGEHYVAVAHRLADENDFYLERGADGERSGAKEVDACRADVTRNQSDGKFLGDIVDAAQSQRKLKGGARVFAVLRMNADGVGGDACEAARVSLWRIRRQMQMRH
jgi:hypothetical protein